MITALARWQNGQIVLLEPVDWPEGSEVIVKLRSASANILQEMVEEEERETPEERERRLAEWEAIPPLEMTAEEREAWRIERDSERAWQLAQDEARMARLEKLWE